MVYSLNSSQLGLLQHPSFVYYGGLTDIIIIWFQAKYHFTSGLAGGHSFLTDQMSLDKKS
jgi:hypothetical protein